MGSLSWNARWVSEIFFLGDLPVALAVESAFVGMWQVNGLL
jgi:hypothetical protein